MSDANTHIADWLAREPGGEMLLLFCPPAQRRLTGLWGALLDEFDQARFDIDETSVAEAKLGWWAEEILRGAMGQARHPVVQALFHEPATASIEPVSWGELGRSLVGAREPGRVASDLDASLATHRDSARALATIETALFGCPAPVTAIAASLLLRQWRGPGSRAGGAGWRWPLQLLARHQTDGEQVRREPRHPVSLGLVRDFSRELRDRLTDAPGGAELRRFRVSCDAWRLRQWAAGRIERQVPGRLTLLGLAWGAGRSAARMRAGSA
jgi:phytoene synthase